MRIEPRPVADPDAATLITEYFDLRAEGFPGVYRPALPGPEAFTAPGEAFLVALDDDGALLGCGAVRLIDGGNRAEVKHVYTRPSARGRGVGRAVMAEIERRAREAGATELVLDTHHSLEAAGAMYAALGFSAIAPYNDNPNATRWYGKVL